MPEAGVPCARAVLFVHGAGGGGWEWNAWARVFAAGGWHAAAPDLVPVAAGLAATRFDDYSAQVAAALAALPRPRVLVGASLGGLLALHRADAADALVLVNPMPPASPGSRTLEQCPQRAIEAWGARASLERTRGAVPDAAPGDAWFAFRRWRDESGAVLNDARAGIACANVACPVLVVGSLDDRDVPVAASRELAAALAADWIEVEDASHVGVVFGLHAARTAARVVTWLNVKIA